MNHFIIDGQYKELIRYFGLDVGEVLRKAELPEDILNKQTITMKEAQYYRFLDALGYLSGDPMLAIKMASTNNIENFSPPIFAAYCSKNAKTCIERLAKYKKLIGPMTYEISENETEFAVEMLPGDPDVEMSNFLVLGDFAFLTNVIRKATKENVSPVRIETREEIDQAAQEFFSCSVEQGDKNTITFSKKDMELPFISYNEAMWSYFEPELSKRLVDLEVDDSVSARVRSALTELLPGGMSSIEDVAEKIGVSRRTLQRKLSEEGTTFQKQLNSTREVLAIHYINNTDMTTNDIAYLLGYAELNSFLRAFTVWTGKSVSKYKKGGSER